LSIAIYYLIDDKGLNAEDTEGGDTESTEKIREEANPRPRFKQRTWSTRTRSEKEPV
jgi:hypothetical protein